jgi:hypothetical protein
MCDCLDTMFLVHTYVYILLISLMFFRKPFRAYSNIYYNNTKEIVLVDLNTLCATLLFFIVSRLLALSLL